MRMLSGEPPLPVVGFALIDAQHRELHAFVERLSLTAAEAPAAVTVLLQLYAATARHFAVEEGLMHRSAYPAMALHEREHELLLDQLRKMRLALARGEVHVGGLMCQLLRNWLLQHIQTHDRPLGAYLIGQPGLLTSAGADRVCAA